MSTDTFYKIHGPFRETLLHANKKEADQPVHPRSLIITFASPSLLIQGYVNLCEVDRDDTLSSFIFLSFYRYFL